MAETDTWTPADDEYVRRSLGTLKADVDTLPLADVRFVKARGSARRRRTMLGWTAGAAAGALVAAVVGFSALGGDNASQPVPPATSTTTTAAPTTPVDREAVSPFLREPGALPLAKEWKLALGWSSDFDTEAVTSYEADPCLGSTQLGRPVQAETLLSAQGNIQGGQTRWAATSGSASGAAAAVARAIGSCQQGEFAVTPVQTDSWPRLYSYKAGGAGSGWYAVATAGKHLAVVTVTEPDHPSSEFSREQVERLAAIATERLEQYGDTSPTTAGPSPTTTSGEDLPVVGSEPLPPSRLFLPASQWSSKLLGKGQRTYAGPGDQEGSASIVQCETDEFLAGIGGRWGVVSIRAGSGDANYIGKQRVRLFEDIQGYELVQADIKRLDTLVMKGCGTAEARTTAERGPVPQTWLLTTRVSGPDASGTMYQWVGMTGMQTEGAVSTLVFHGTDDGRGFTGTKAQGFAELERLMDLARLP
ncbi:hypothetical protein [Knoellia sp. p5-6-4]|uniref:hypothetical protein n=1 Tax=unclassified Knoellia TaxID=2618719 RepID=UPI0023DC1587|nr:hypothetical protein [Knoellia sp. p5-6-4]MDF2146635.1 hypothetical protein [Knoellia sp. p5-6-4]